MNLKIWFIVREGQVTGPFNPEEIESQISDLNKTMPSQPEPQIWGRGHTEWMSLGKWRQLLREQQPLKEVDPVNSEQLWKIRLNGVEKTPMPYSDLIAYLKKSNEFVNVDLSFGNSGWKEIFAFQKVVDDLEISRRSHSRVPIVGTLSCENFSCRVISISEGGLGVNDAQKLQIGERVLATLTSPNLYVTISSTCEVVYVGADGYAGLRFIGLTEEFKSSIIEYINKFATA